MVPHVVSLKNIMEETDRLGDFGPLINLLSADVVFEATIREGTPISGKFTGKAAVTEYFTKILPQVAVFTQMRPRHYFASENGVVILGDDAYTLVKNNKTFRSAYAMLVTFKEALIDYILIIQDLSGIYEAYH
jgi:ketosteroid isomerase-like protein